MNIYIDIETLPTNNEQIADLLRKSIKAPGNYKDPKKIESYIEQHKDKVVSETALSGLFGQVLCVGLAQDEGGSDTYYLNDYKNEGVMLAAVREDICTGLSRNQEYCQNNLVGSNSAEFDIPFLSQRMMINGLSPLFRHGTKPWDMGQDIMLMFACGSKKYYSLNNLCTAFGVKSPKGDLDGSKIHQAYLDGRHGDIRDYCAADVIATREVYKKMTQHNRAA